MGMVDTLAGHRAAFNLDLSSMSGIPKGYFHSSIFEIPVRPMRVDQSLSLMHCTFLSRYYLILKLIART